MTFDDICFLKYELLHHVTYRDRLLHVSSVERRVVDVNDDPVEQSAV